MLELALTIIIYLILVIPVGIYVYHIAAGKKTFADPVFNRFDGVIYKIGGVNPHKGMNWKQYALALLGTNGIMILIGYLILRIQSLPIFNPNGVGAMEETLSFTDETVDWMLDNGVWTEAWLEQMGGREAITAIPDTDQLLLYAVVDGQLCIYTGTYYEEGQKATVLEALTLMVQTTEILR